MEKNVELKAGIFEELYGGYKCGSRQTEFLADTDSSVVRPSTFQGKILISQKLFDNFFSSFEYNIYGMFANHCEQVDLIESL